MTCSRVTAILMNRCILPICSVSSGRVSFFHRGFPIALYIRSYSNKKHYSYMDQFILYFLSSVWNMSLNPYSLTPEPPCVLWSFHYAHWPGSHCRTHSGFVYFLIFCLNFPKKNSFLVIPKSCFTDLSKKHFTEKRGTLDFYFSISPKTHF